MGKWQTIIISDPTYEGLVNKADKHGESGWEPFHFERNVQAQNGTVLAMLLRRFIPDPEEEALAAAMAGMPQPEPEPQPGVLMTEPAPSAPAVPVPTPSADGPQHPMIQAGIPPLLVNLIHRVAALEGKNPKEWMIEALQSYTRIAIDALEQDGRIVKNADGSFTEVQQQ